MVSERNNDTVCGKRLLIPTISMSLDPISNSPVCSLLRLLNLKCVQLSIPMIATNHVHFSDSSFMTSSDLGIESTQKGTRRSDVTYSVSPYL